MLNLSLIRNYDGKRGEIGRESFLAGLLTQLNINFVSQSPVVAVELGPLLLLLASIYYYVTINYIVTVLFLLVLRTLSAAGVVRVEIRVQILNNCADVWAEILSFGGSNVDILRVRLVRGCSVVRVVKRRWFIVAVATRRYRWRWNVMIQLVIQRQWRRFELIGIFDGLVLWIAGEENVLEILCRPSMCFLTRLIVRKRGDKIVLLMVVFDQLIRIWLKVRSWRGGWKVSEVSFLARVDRAHALSWNLLLKLNNWCARRRYDGNVELFARRFLKVLGYHLRERQATSDWWFFLAETLRQILVSIDFISFIWSTLICVLVIIIILDRNVTATADVGKVNFRLCVAVN